MSLYCLWRILGNDLPPRHNEQQTLENLRFILENEEVFPDCEKRFLLNRILSVELVEQYKELLAQYGYEFDEIPVDGDEYSQIPLMQHRAAYLTNVNPARNRCLSAFDEEFDFVLPFDGACFFRRDGWDGLASVISTNFEDGYFFCPMWRLRHLEYALTCDQPPQIRETYRHMSSESKTQVERIGLTEPQIVFGKTADLGFSEKLMYANADKAELLCRLGLPGVWETWEPRGSRGQPLRANSVWHGKVKMGGFVCRLPSGNLRADVNNRHRGSDRQIGMRLLVDQADSLFGI